MKIEAIVFFAKVVLLTVLTVAAWVVLLAPDGVGFGSGILLMLLDCN